MKYKAIVIGASTSGKTTLLRHLKETTDLLIDESDDVLTAMNGGSYPQDSAYKMNVLAPKMVKDVLHRDNVIFFTNTDYFQPEDLRKARELGFRIIQLHADRDEMERRNQHRIKHEGYDDLSKHFEVMLAYLNDIKKQRLIDKVIETNQPVDKLASELLQEVA